ncbi:Putative Lipase/serine esterase [[Torrubiella] hemipterigena]|uniref:Putative Lipase/serine esterase n=1 Tax=[Torrubiella] hemipterigena TaxID=1531966 RepID=A0A0A1SZ49_9HYPO|nr:Putative Lipase/serine esterase [[Torrubiella] hemipterigena]
MLLLHQVGSVKIGEVIRYTVTYTPSEDRILPSPEKLFVRIRNTSAIALRAAFIHGPYSLTVATYPASFDPNEKFENPRRYGIPQYEPMLKAGGSWESELVVPDNIRQSAGIGASGGFGGGPETADQSASWIIEISSQVLFSTSVDVGFEVVVARDRKSLNLSSASGSSSNLNQPAGPGSIKDLQQSIGSKDGHHQAQLKGIFSRAVKLVVVDTATMWNTPRLPGWDDAGSERIKESAAADAPVESVVEKDTPETTEHKEKPPKKIHLVILTHGLHSNLGADMLFMKESIDAAAKKAKLDAKARREKARAEKANSEKEPIDDGSDDDEDVIVRGYSGNATKTEKGIKYLGKRLARYVLSITYPDQPFLPIGKGAGEGSAEKYRKEDWKDDHLTRAHKHSALVKDTIPGHLAKHKRSYKITSISFIGHSLGGLVQTYAVAYIQKHSPEFFDLIKPVNFIALATPFLGLSNENPLYVKFALDFGLVGRTGKDLGLTWRAPTIARNGWGALVSNLGETAHKRVYGESQTESKPLLRILPTGPAHIALKKFRNRTVYSNVVNDGIVPLRTSCLLFLDWQGLGRVEKARRDAGLVETVVGFGWAELTGTNLAGVKQKHRNSNEDDALDSGASTPRHNSHQVPQPDDNAMDEVDKASLHSVISRTSEPLPPAEASPSETTFKVPLAGLFNFFKSNEPPKPEIVSQKQKKMIRRAQTINFDESPQSTPTSSTSDVTSGKGNKVTSGHELEIEVGTVTAPPKTTIFESAGDLLNPKVPSVEYLLDPSKRPRTIFHDRVYHPNDIPPPPLKKRSTSSLLRRRTSKIQKDGSQDSPSSGSSSPYPGVDHQDSMASAKDYDDTANTNPDKDPNQVVDGSGMRVEEKIARGYHRGLAWRKVLVKLEPDAHNNIIVRRTFVNAFGWPVMKHLVDSHFSDSAVSRMKTEDEHIGERALDMSVPPDEHGTETKTTSDPAKEDPASPIIATAEPLAQEQLEVRDKVAALRRRNEEVISPSSPNHGSVTWSERDWDDSEADSDDDHKNSKGSKSDKAKGQDGSSSWSWAEKIVGKRAKSPAVEPTA